MKGVYLLLGSNLGDKRSQLKTAIKFIQEYMEIIEFSGLYESEAWGIKEQPAFLNQILRGNCHLTPEELLSKILETENKMGRERQIKWGERLIDIDILYYSNRKVDFPDLKIPHPYIQERRFTLLPLAEISPGLEHPVFKKTQAQLLESCKDSLNVHLIS